MNSQSSLKLMSIELVMPSSHLILCFPLFLLPSTFLSIRGFPNEPSHQVAKVWSISPSNEYSGLISFKVNWLYLLAVQRSPLLQHLSSKASVLWHSVFFMVQLSHPYVTTGKTIALTLWTFVSKMISLVFNMLSSLVVTFLPRSKCLLISWLQSPSAVILEPRKINSLTVSIVSATICYEVMGLDAMIFFVFECWVLSQLFHSPLSVSSRGSLVLLCFLP